MADNWWDKYPDLTDKMNNAKSESLPTQDNWWDKYPDITNQSSKPEINANKIPRDKSILERVPLVGKYASKYKDYESDQVNKVNEKNPGYRAAYYNNKKLEGVANDVMGSIATTAATGPGLILNMLSQGGYAASSKLKDLVTEKGSDIDASDVGSVAKSGALGSAGPLVGKIISPIAKVKLPVNPSPDKTTYSSILGVLRGGNKSADLDTIVAKHYAAKQAQRIADTSDKISEGIQSYKDSIPNALSRAFMGGALPYMVGGHPLMTSAGAVAAAAAPHVPFAASKYIHNQLMSNPGTDAILKALITSGAANR